MQAGKPGVFVITGPAGSGKSAIAGRIVSLSNPAQRARLSGAAPLDSPDPGEGAVDAQVHARRLTVDQVVEAIDHQLVLHGLLAPRSGGGTRNRGELLAGLERLDRCPLVVLDGLDEAGEEAWAIAKDVIGLLAGSACLLIATRWLPSKTQGEPDLMQALAPQSMIDLGAPDLAEQTQHDVAAYVRKRLAGHDPDRMDASKVAEAILRFSAQGNEGAFLLAQVTTSQLRAAPIDTSVPGWEGALSRSLEEAFDRDLVRIEDPDGVRELLAALAWTYGSGLPDDLWPVVATALSSTGRPYSRLDVHTVLGSAGRYIVEDGDGTRAVYRLSHQRLVKKLHLPAKPRELDAYHAQAARVARALVDRCRDLLATGLQPSDSPYLWRYTWRHSADGGPQGIAALRELVEIDANAFLPDLARALNNLGSSYREVGRRQDAVAPTEESVRLRRTLAADNPAFLLDLAGALINLGIQYSEVGRRQDAVAPIKEAVRLRRTLAADNSAFLPDLASALNNLGNAYRDTRSFAAARGAYEESRAIRRRLAAERQFKAALQCRAAREGSASATAPASGPWEAWEDAGRRWITATLEGIRELSDTFAPKPRLGMGFRGGHRGTSAPSETSPSAPRPSIAINWIPVDLRPERTEEGGAYRLLLKHQREAPEQAPAVTFEIDGETVAPEKIHYPKPMLHLVFRAALDPTAVICEVSETASGEGFVAVRLKRATE
jgi:tetratricopeptide (TPR) repeat protein